MNGSAGKRAHRNGGITEEEQRYAYLEEQRHVRVASDPRLHGIAEDERNVDEAYRIGKGKIARDSHEDDEHHGRARPRNERARTQAQLHPVDCLGDAEQREARQARPFRVDKGEEQVGERRGNKTRHDYIRVRVARPSCFAVIVMKICNLTPEAGTRNVRSSCPWSLAGWPGCKKL